MLQDFRRRTTPDTGAARLAALRAAMAEAGVDAFLVPRADAHQGENVAPRDERLAWLTGFTGSAGLALVTAGRAAVFVDGRYRLQVRGQVDPDRFEVRRIPEDKPADWLAEALPRRRPAGLRPLAAHREGDRGADRGARAAADRAGAGSEPRRPRLARPAAAAGRPIVPHPVELAGRASADKRASSPAGWSTRDLSAAVLTLPEFHRLAPERARLGHRPHAGAARLRHPARRRARGALRRPRPGRRGAARASRAGGAGGGARRPSGRRSTRSAGGSPSTGRARRSGSRTGSPPPGRRRWSGSATPASCRRRSRPTAEIAGARAAHLRDGAAMAEFLAWLDATAPEGGLSEIDVVRRLEEIRAATGRLATSPSRRSAAPGRTARSCTTGSPRPRTGG